MSKLPDFLEPIEDFSMYGVSLADMDRTDLLKAIKWLVDEMQHYKKSAEESGDRFSKYLLEHRAAPPQQISKGE